MKHPLRGESPPAVRGDKIMKKILCMLLALLLCTGCLLTGCTAVPTEQNNDTEKPEISEDFLKAVIQFCADSAALVVAQGGAEENIAFSPVSLYMALAMTSMGAENETLDAMLKAFHMEGMGKETVAEESRKLFNSIYFDNDIGKSYLANSVWIDDELKVKEDFYKITAAKFSASAHNVDLQDKTAQAEISKWVEEQTNGKVTRPVPDDTVGVVMSLINAIYFIDQWSSQFNPEITKNADFTLADGSKVNVPFMRQRLKEPRYVKTKDYETVTMSFKNGYQMNFYLPAGSVSASDLLTKNLILRGAEEQAANVAEDTDCQADISLPKFDIKADMNLTQMLDKLGMGIARDPEKADFTGMSDQKPLFIFSVVQSAVVTVDEQGCEAAAFTEAMSAGSAMEEPKVVEFNLNRPFAFTITNSHDVTLFCGVVNNPQA